MDITRIEKDVIGCYSSAIEFFAKFNQMRKTKMAWLGNPMMSKFILCKYSESESGEVKLVRAAEEAFSNEEEAKNCALNLYQKDNSTRFVLLMELELPASNW
ncbi:MAG TPA: hypothetical protein VGN95_11020 [Pyrinomonadaceae bacterium]|nr:hypothetical protein [Pyrinomonadaceae bacterium]